MTINDQTGLEIAVIGVACRFPGAGNVIEFWENLKQGKETIRFFSDNELIEKGINERIIKNPAYVKAKGIIEGAEYFDSSFFNYSPQEAAVLDPQLRIFHECCWHALEDAGYVPDHKLSIGLYAGMSDNIKWKISKLFGYSNVSEQFNASTLLLNSFTTLISYKLNLRGPSHTVQTACSTSLVAIHVASQALLSGDCDIALAGGSTIDSPMYGGYLYQEGMISSPDGHCRTFDENANGTVFGNGVGIVVLKRLEEAIEDRDNIYAVIKGTAINNDGDRKTGYTAPSVEGQAEVIIKAHLAARIEPDTISYIETHGTATKLGDPIEIEALKIAFNTERTRFCAIGSVKTNIGHLDCAAGVAGFIKTVLALKYKQIPASLHFNKPNKDIDFENSPFYVNTQCKEWKNNGIPRRAGVSSFGIGGTNAHIVLEEASRVVSFVNDRNFNLLLLSAKTSSSLDEAMQNLSDYLREHPDISLSDVAYTLKVGRKAFDFRRVLICSGIKDAIRIIESAKGEEAGFEKVTGKNLSVIFMFPGQGSQYVNMGLGLYQTEPFFRQKVDECIGIISPYFNYDIKSVLFFGEQESKVINETQAAQLHLFIIEYSLAELLINWGIKPQAMIGHSIGEYVAACLSGVFTLKEALHLVVLRGKLMQSMPKGTMLGVTLSEDEVKTWINEEISLAAVNAKNLCVLSGPHGAIEKISNQFTDKNIPFRSLETSHAFHSGMMEPILNAFEEEVKKINIKVPQIPYISNLSGTWATYEQIKSPRYWANHLRNTVRFYEGIKELDKLDNAVFIETGPGKTLSSLTAQCTDTGFSHKIFNLLKHPKEQVSDDYYFVNALGNLWLTGIEIDWQSYYAGEKHNRVALPTYSFNKQVFESEPAAIKLSEGFLSKGLEKKQDMADWFYIPVWEQSFIRNQDISNPVPEKILIFSDGSPMCSMLTGKFNSAGCRATVVRSGRAFKQVNKTNYYLSPANEGDYFKLFEELTKSGRVPDIILHTWNVNNTKTLNLPDQLDKTLDSGLYSLINISRSIGKNNISKNICIYVITSNIHSITGDENIHPLKAAVLGTVKIIPLEFLNIKCKIIDIPAGSSQNKQSEAVSEQIFYEIKAQNFSDIFIGYRGKNRWVLKYKPIHVEAPKKSFFREDGTYMITGGFGAMGFSFAEHIAKKYNANLVLISRSSLPDRKDWDRYLNSGEVDDTVKHRISKIRELEQYGSKIMVCKADVSDYRQISKIAQAVEKKFGNVNGILHTAGLADYAGIIQLRTKKQTEEILAPKVKGTLVLDKFFSGKNLEFFVCFSSSGNQLFHVKFGQVGYVAANEFLDAFSHYKTNIVSGTVYKTINWADWYEAGISVEAVKKRVGDQKLDYKSVLKDAISVDEGISVLYRALNNQFNQVIVSVQDLNLRIGKTNKPIAEKEGEIKDVPERRRKQVSPRPNLNTEYTAPKNNVEKKLTKIYEDFFGYSQLGINDNFFDIGGDSLKALSLLQIVKNEFKIELSLNNFLNSTTIKSLATLIKDKDNEKIDRVSVNFFFGESPKIYGTLVMPENKQDCKKTGIVLCHPIGQEYIYSYQAYALLSNTLANKGFPSVRFDYTGCGNSEGEISEVNIKVWLENIARSVHEIRKKCGVTDIILTGARFGAAIASIYLREKHNINGLVLWNPILYGDKYLTELKKDHKKWLSGSFSKIKHEVKGGIESQGFFIPDSLAEEIKKINLLQAIPEKKVKLLLIDNPDDKYVKVYCGYLASSFQVSMKNKVNHDFWKKQGTEKAKRMLPDEEIAFIQEWIIKNYE